MNKIKPQLLFIAQQLLKIATKTIEITFITFSFLFLQPPPSTSCHHHSHCHSHPPPTYTKNYEFLKIISPPFHPCWTSSHCLHPPANLSQTKTHLTNKIYNPKFLSSPPTNPSQIAQPSNWESVGDTGISCWFLNPCLECLFGHLKLSSQTIELQWPQYPLLYLYLQDGRPANEQNISIEATK